MLIASKCIPNSIRVVGLPCFTFEISENNFVKNSSLVTFLYNTLTMSRLCRDVLCFQLVTHFYAYPLMSFPDLGWFQTDIYMIKVDFKAD
ncbi:unknown [Prevotella sp. CAG:1185]|nr:unknown [Prevotella sp. CAG:1185]